MRPRWKLIGLAGVAGVGAGGVVVARQRRSPGDYDPDELRERLHRRLAESSESADDPTAATGESVAESQ
jgi:hypothetical protein